MFKFLKRKRSKVYILYKDCVQRDKHYSGILGVYSNYSEALRHYADERNKEALFWDDEMIECNAENYFYAFENGNYSPNHCVLAIVEKYIEDIYNNKKKND